MNGLASKITGVQAKEKAEVESSLRSSERWIAAESAASAGGIDKEGRIFMGTKRSVGSRGDASWVTALVQWRSRWRRSTRS